MDSLNGTHGFLKGYSDAADATKAVANLSSVWETMRIGVKPYPARRYTHAAVDGVLDLVQSENLSVADIKRITVGLHRNGIALVGAPLEAKRRARSVVDGQFSMPFAAAVALQRGRFGWDDYDLLGKVETDALSDKIDVQHDTSLEGLRHPFGATLKVEVGGKVIERRIADPSGEPETFPSAMASEAKFRSLTDPVSNGSAVDWLARARGLATAPSVRAYLKGF